MLPVILNLLLLCWLDLRPESLRPRRMAVDVNYAFNDGNLFLVSLFLKAR